MIYRDEETYQLFDDNQSKPESQEFGYKESYWNEMEGILDANDAKRKKRKLILFALSSVSVIALVFLGLSTMNSDKIGTSAVVFNTGSEASSSSNKRISDNSNVSNTDVNELNETEQINHSDELLSQQSSSNVPVVSNKSSSESPENTVADEKLNEELVLPVEDKSSSESLTNTVVDEKLNEDVALVVASESSSSTLNENLIVLDRMEVGLLEQPAISNTIQLENRKVKFRLMHSLSLNAEGGIANKYQSDLDVSYVGMLGIGYELAFHKNLSFQTGANFIYRNGLAQTYKNETKVYGFKSTRYYQDISYKGQFNIEIPISLKIRLKRSAITAGVGTSFLLGVRSSVSQYMPESSSIETVKNNWGIKEGIRKMDVNLNLSYSYAVTTNMELTAGISAGLLDQTDNQFFSSDEKNYNMQFRLGLKYFFLNK